MFITVFTNFAYRNSSHRGILSCLHLNWEYYEKLQKENNSTEYYKMLQNASQQNKNQCILNAIDPLNVLAIRTNL